MSEEQFDFMQGQMQALSFVIGQILANTNPTIAGHMAQSIAEEQDSRNQEDLAENAPALGTRSRNSILTAYVELLETVASHG